MADKKILHQDLELGAAGEDRSLKIYGPDGGVNEAAVTLKAPLSDFVSIEIALPSVISDKGFLQTDEYGNTSFVKDYHRHEQGISSALWSITHNMGKRPSVTTTDSAGTRVYGEVKYSDENSLTITFSAAFSGYAELN